MKGFSAIILAGGKSSRMGTDKSNLIMNGKTFLEHALALTSPFDDKLVSYNTDLDLGDNIRVIHDEQNDIGPLGGLLSCLPVIRNEAAMVLSIDTPCLTPAIVQELVESYRGNLVISTCAERVHPLVGIYPKNCLPQMRKYVYKGKRSVMGFIQEVEVDYCEFDRAMKSCFENINTPDEFNTIKHEIEN
jgi:molybdopterin-guanine dinucleotide biosynthesis protein A